MTDEDAKKIENALAAVTSKIAEGVRSGFDISLIERLRAEVRAALSPSRTTAPRLRLDPDDARVIGDAIAAAIDEHARLLRSQQQADERGNVITKAALAPMVSAKAESVLRRLCPKP